MPLTPTQHEAIAARGNVVVVAGAGTGKTRTLVERCLDCLLDDEARISLDEILMVTFTDAAAAEMRHRIRARLEEELKAHAGEPRWQEQLALFETAHIGTLHSFCLELVRQHFYDLELDPQLVVLASAEAGLLAAETIAAVLQAHYAGSEATARAVQAFIQLHGGGRDKSVRALILRLHHYTQTLPNPEGWFMEQQKLLETDRPEAWLGWLRDVLADWPTQWRLLLTRAAATNHLAKICLASAEKIALAPDRALAAAALSEILAARENCSHGKRGAWITPLKEFFEEAEFLASLSTMGRDGDPLADDWNCVRAHTKTLLDLTREFHTAFADAKRELGMLDFHDLEQFALRLLRDPKTGQPTDIARQWRQKLRFVFVDEYQDINAAQDKIIEALSRDGADANRFLVGDVKQSIYRFRLANPRIFQGYVNTWHNPPGRKIPLTDNFRSREAILNFINSLFATVMTPELGGVSYDAEASLKFGAPGERKALTLASDRGPRVEFHLRSKISTRTEPADDDETSVLAKTMDLKDADLEARMVALRLRELKAQSHEIWDEEIEAFRPIEWSDIAILLRAPSAKAESYAKEFSRLNIPLQVVRGGFYNSTEISDLINLLKLLDNPLQDVPAVAVLRSPLVGLDLEELARVRLVDRRVPFFTALVKWNSIAKEKVETAVGDSEPHPGRIPTFLHRFARWRHLARQVSVSRCLEVVLAATHYDAWLLTQARGLERHANVQRFLALAQRFDQLQRQGLFRFLRYLEGQQDSENEPESGPIAAENSVRLMSIHRSKGLEFPVVVVADLAKTFNEMDLNADVILDEHYGLCPQVYAPATGKRYPSLPYWLARRRQRREILGEEVRLLYVALTRARDKLILTASIPKKDLEGAWRGGAGTEIESADSAHSYADWLARWCALNGGLEFPLPLGPGAGQNALLRWQLHEDSEFFGPGTDAEPGMTAPGPDLSAAPQVWEDLRCRLAWQYPHPAAKIQPAKMTVSALRLRAAELDDEALRPQPTPGIRQLASSSETIGKAHHKFLQLVSLESASTQEALRGEAERMVADGALTPEEIKLLNWGELAAFWRSDLGREVRVQARYVRRELAFTARFSPAELARLTGLPAEPELADEFVVVQGIADLVLILPGEIRLLDFKTDSVRPGELEAKTRAYEPQLRLYAEALSRIYHRPVSACWLCFLRARTSVRLPGYPFT